MQVTLIGIDLAKSVFQVCGVNQAGKPVFNRSVRRKQLLKFLLQYPQATMAMEACSGSNFWGRELRRLGLNALLIPPQHVKPFVKGNKNDRNDAFAITEAARRPRLRFVEPRSLEQTELLMRHRLLSRKTQARTALINQIRGFLNEYGIVVGRGKHKVAAVLPDLLAAPDNALTPTARELLYAMWEEWRQMDEAIKLLEKQMKQQARGCDAARRLMGVRGIAEKTATALAGYVGTGHAYRNGRHLAAALGLVPKEHSSGGKQKLGGITKRGNAYIRFLLVQGAWSVIQHAHRNDDRLSRWARDLIARRGKPKAAVAVANKLARISWALLYHQREYQAVR